jgi:mannose-6-phosphate isomerase-like protein (cupin superfamily)
MKSHNCHVKLLIVEKDGKLSLQKHKHRSEHWTVTAGKARVVKGQEEIELAVDNSIKIEKGEVHRITNIGDEELNIIEVQIGDYFGEDDIQRFDDVYDRK